MQKNDIGTLFEVTCIDRETGAVIDLSTAATKQFEFKKPSAAYLAVTADFVTTGVDGKLKYVTVNTNLSESGDWTLWAYVTFADGAAWRSPPLKFTVGENAA